MGNQQPSREQRKVQRLSARLSQLGDEDIVYSPKKYRETEGTKDYSGYTASSFREISSAEASYSGQTAYQVINSMTTSTIQKLLTASSVEYTGSPTVADNTYTFAGGYSAGMVKISGWKSYDYNTSAETTITFDGGYAGARMKIEEADGTTTSTPNAKAFTTATLPSAVSRPAAPTTVSSLNVLYTPSADRTLKAGTQYICYGCTPYDTTVYDCSTWANYYLASDVSTSTVTVTPYAYGNTGGGTITVTPYGSGNTGGGTVTYTPETTESASTTTLDTSYYAYSASSATSTTKTFLTKS